MTYTPQPSIFSQGTSAHLHLQFRTETDTFAAAVKRVSAFALELPAVNKVGITIGFCPSKLRKELFRELPDNIQDFTDITGKDGFTIPGAQQDIWVWLVGAGQDLLFDTGMDLLGTLGDSAELIDERKGFAYKNNRDMTGFIDGTENPSFSEAPQIALIPAGSAQGGSICLVQIWQHDLKNFRQLDTDSQEKIFGRTKDTSEELDDSKKPADSHIARVVIEENGSELEIFRQSVPYGNLEHHGLVFVAFTPEQHRTDLMLRRMTGETDGIRDALTLYSTPLASAYYFIPAIETLELFSDDADQVQGKA